MKHRMVIDLRRQGNLSEQQGEERATQVFGMMKDFVQVLKSRNIELDLCMLTRSDHDEANSVTMHDACAHEFEYVPETSMGGGSEYNGAVYIRCVKCGARYPLEDTLPEGTHEHELSWDPETEEMSCAQCAGEFSMNAESEYILCEHEFVVDQDLRVAKCSLCDMMFDVKEFAGLDAAVLDPAGRHISDAHDPLKDAPPTVDLSTKPESFFDGQEV